MGVEDLHGRRTIMGGRENGMMPTGIYRDAAMIAIGLVIGLAVGWYLWRPPAPVHEDHAKEVALPSGGIVLEREPEAPVPAPIKQAVKELNRKAKIERVVKVT